MRRIILALAVVLLLLVAAVIGLVLTLDVNQYKPRIVAAVRDATHRELSIDGDIAFKPALLPTLAVNGLRLGNAPWASKDPLLEVQHFDARIALLPLLSRRIEISHIEIDGARVVLETNAEGRGNWQLQAAASTAAQNDNGLPAFAVGSLAVKDSVLEYRAYGQPPQRLAMQTLAITSDAAQGPLSLAMAVQYQQLPLSISGSIAPFAQWLADGPCPIALTVQANTLELAVHGEVSQLLKSARAKLSVDLKAPTLAALAQIAGLPLNTTAPVTAHGEISYDGDSLTTNSTALIGKLKIAGDGALTHLRSQPSLAFKVAVDAPALNDVGALLGRSMPALAPAHLEAQLAATARALSIEALKINIARSDATGTVRVTADGDRRNVELDLRSRYLDLSPFDPAPVKKVPRRARMLSSEPVDLTALKGLDGHLSYQSNKVWSRGLAFDNLKLNASLQRGTLTLAPLAVALGKGSVQTHLTLNAEGATPRISLQGSAHGLPLVAWLDGSNGVTAPDGSADIEVKLDGQGTSVAALLGGANGHVLLDARNLSMNGKGAALASADLLMSALTLLNPMSQRSEATHIECAVANFPIVGGRMENQTGLGISTDQLRILGGGSIDLRSEQLDIGVDPKPRSGIGLSMAGMADFIRIGGTLAAPTPVTDARGAASAGVKVGAAIATGGLSLLAQGLLDRSTGDVDVCAVARGDKTLNGAAGNSAAQQPTTSTAGRVMQGAGNAVKSAGEAVKGAFKSLFGH